jgi:hypothetical protein
VDAFIGAPARPVEIVMGRHQPLPLRVRHAAERRATSRPLTQRQERLFLYVVFTIGIALHLAATLKLIPFLN